MDSRREFIKKAALLASGTSLADILPTSIQKALTINPALGSTYLDAEHVVILMQENRSFDHCYGTLQGVRGFNDPRAISLPNKNLVWLQTNAAGETYMPFRLNIKDTKATWMSSLPHSWTNQVDARNGGKHDKWLDAKLPGNKEYANMPLTLGYYSREDIPFYYALADAFTVCDQNFCSSLTGTTPNRLYLWTGTIRKQQSQTSKANIRNEDVNYKNEADWTTFPERLEDNGISWRIYQNEISLPVGFTEEEEAWLANFTDNPIEWFNQYNVRFSPSYYQHLQKLIQTLPTEIEILKAKQNTLFEIGKESEGIQKELLKKQTTLQKAREDLEKWNPETFEKLSKRAKNLHQKAFTTNQKDANYHHLTTLKYRDGHIKREVKIPKGDVLYQFREDVKNGSLPTVSWVVAPENFSDHPSAPWYGAWYVSEMLDILTHNPAVWKKTIFILCYDENDGYFDHIPPFVPPHPSLPHTGKTSQGINTEIEYVSLEQELARKKLNPEIDSRSCSIGLGYRVPLVIASPWSRGGTVNSQVFDHTSILQFLEKFISQKTGKKIEESNISHWRRTVCGDLTSVFNPYQGEKMDILPFLAKEPFIERIHKAKFKNIPSGFCRLTKEEATRITSDPSSSPCMPRQEKGIRPSSALPYQLYADGNLNRNKKTFEIRFEARNEVFGAQSAGSPFLVYAPGRYVSMPTNEERGPFEVNRNWAYAVTAGDHLLDTWPLHDFEKETYHLRVYGPNGFFREFQGNAVDPLVEIAFDYQLDSLKKPTGNIELMFTNLNSTHSYTVQVIDNSYKGKPQTKTLKNKGVKGDQALLTLDLSKSFNWYDFSVKVIDHPIFEKRYAGRVETGKIGLTDPFMGYGIDF